MAKATRATTAPDRRSSGDQRPRPSGPVRTCVGCRTARASTELVRVARGADGNLAFGRTLQGRGAWLCHDTLISCLERATRTGGFARAFRTAIPAENLQSLRARVDAADEDFGTRFVPDTPPARD